MPTAEAFAFLLGCADNAWRKIVRQDCPQLPSSYTNRFYVDSAVFHPCALGLLIDVMGDERIMHGSDYRFPLGEEKVGDLIRGADLPERTERKLLGTNALACFSLR